MGRGRKIIDIELVVDGAIALIEEGGVEEFSTRRLAVRLGISAMTLYNYYDNRQAILTGALHRGLGLLWEGLFEKITAWRASGGNPLGAYRLLADHVLAYAIAHPRLCRFILTEGATGDWKVRAGQIERIYGPGGKGEGLLSEPLRQDIYLFELLIFALTLKVLGGGESAERFRELSTAGYEKLLGLYEDSVA